MTQTSYMAKPQSLKTTTYVVDATDQILGRLATNVARVLRGKHRPEFTPHANTGDFVIVINASKIKVTGNKATGKEYDRYSGYPSGRHVRTFVQQMERDATRPLRDAVRGMLQHNTLGDAQFGRLRVYAGDVHPHHAQQPVSVHFGPLGEIVHASDNN